jgi:hypothetical protein
VRRPESLHVRGSQSDIEFEKLHPLVSILKLFVMFASGLSSVCHFGRDGEIMGALTA